MLVYFLNLNIIFVSLLNTKISCLLVYFNLNKNKKKRIILAINFPPLLCVCVCAPSLFLPILVLSHERFFTANTPSIFFLKFPPKLSPTSLKISMHRKERNLKEKDPQGVPSRLLYLLHNFPITPLYPHFPSSQFYRASPFSSSHT